MNITLRERFDRKWILEPFSGCWIWTFSRNSTGYGQIKVDGKMMKAHRVSWLLYKGPIDLGLFVCHKCDIRPCVNPDHLFLGTQLDNMRDSYRKGRYHNGNADLNPDKVSALRLLAKAGVKYQELGKVFGIKAAAASRAARGVTWPKLPDATGPRPSRWSKRKSALLPKNNLDLFPSTE